MGPYCNFCGTRCFVHLPQDTPKAYLAMLEALGYRGIILSTCSGGKALEHGRLGFRIDDIRAAILRQEAA